MLRDLIFTRLLIFTQIKRKKSPELFIKFLMRLNISIVWILFIMILSQKTYYLILIPKLLKLLILERLFRWILPFKSYWDKEELFHTMRLNIFITFVQEKWMFGPVAWFSTIFWMESFIFMTKIEKKCIRRFLPNKFSFKVHFSFISGYNWINRSP